MSAKGQDLPIVPIFIESFLYDGAAKGIVAQAVTGAGVTFLNTAQRITKEVSRSVAQWLSAGQKQDELCIATQFTEGPSLMPSSLFLSPPLALLQLPDCDGAIGWAYLGAFYTVAPWPLRSLSRASDLMDTLVKRAPTSRRNRYCTSTAPRAHRTSCTHSHGLLMPNCASDHGVVALRRERWQEAADDFALALNLRCISLSEQDFCDFIESEARRGRALALSKLGTATSH